jgi:hypothetical protein
MHPISGGAEQARQRETPRDGETAWGSGRDAFAQLQERPRRPGRLRHLGRGEAKDEAFHSNTAMQGYFKEYATMLANRTNTVTGLPHKDEPAIMAWEASS